MRVAPSIWRNSRGVVFLIVCQGALLLQCFHVQAFNRIPLTRTSALENGWVVLPKKLQTPDSNRRRTRAGIRTGAVSDDDETSNTAEKIPMFMDQSGAKAPSFGESVSIRNRPKETADVLFQQDKVLHADASSSESVTEDGPSEARIVADKLLRRNKIVAFASIVLAVSSWLWQVAHPVTPIQLLVAMEERSADITVVGHNGKPTVVDFWAPWCENCKLSAATMNEIEAEYGDRVNFIMVNGDDMARNGKLVEAFGVDAIPHVAMVEADGTVDTALIGPIPKRILRANLDMLIENSSKETHEALPYKMLDVFENRPQDRRVSF